MIADSEHAEITGYLTKSTLPNEPRFDNSVVQIDDHLQSDRRSRIETFFDLLYVIGSGTEKPTHIMYKANLSWTIMHLYIDSMIRKGLLLVDETEGKKRYRLSEKGGRIMQQYLSIKEDLDLISEKRK